MFVPYTVQTVLSHIPLSEADSHSFPPSIGLFARRGPPNAPGSPKDNHAGGQTTQPRLSVEAVEAWDNNLYLGTSDGHVLRYSLEDATTVNAAANEESADVDSIRSRTDSASSTPSSPGIGRRPRQKLYHTRLESRLNIGFGRKTVETILVMPQVSKAVVLCDSTVSFYTLPFFDPIPSSVIPHIKGVTCISQDFAQEGHIGPDGTLRLCVVKRRQAQLYKVGEFVSLEKELALPDGARTLATHSTHSCLADQLMYKLLDMRSAGITPLVPVPSSAGNQGAVGKALVTVIGVGEFLVVIGGGSQTSIGMFVSFTGDAIRGTLEWSGPPKAVGVEFPYAAALLRNNTVEVHDIVDQQLLQVIQLNPATEPRGISLGHGIRVHLPELAAKLTVRKGQTFQELEGEISISSSRLSSMPTRLLVYGKDSLVALLATPLILQAEELFDKNAIEDAVQAAERTQMKMGPENASRDRLRMEQEYIFQKAGFLLLDLTVFDDGLTLLNRGHLDPRIVIRLFTPQAVNDLHIDYGHEWLSIYEGIWRLYTELESIDNIVSRNMKKHYSPHIQPDVDTASATVELKQVLLANAKEAFRRYLLAQRNKQRNDDRREPSIRQAIDNALLLTYAEQKDTAEIYRLVEGEHNCDGEAVAQLLTDQHYYHALSLVWKANKQLDQTLELWTKMVEGTLPDEHFKDGLEQIATLLASDQVNPALLTQYGWWLFARDTDRGVKVFTTSPFSSSLDSSAILAGLEENDSASVTRYLEYLIYVQGDVEPEKHTKLALRYVDEIQKSFLKSHAMDAETKLLGFYSNWTSLTDQVTPLIPSSAKSNYPRTNTTFITFLCTLIRNRKEEDAETPDESTQPNQINVWQKSLMARLRLLRLLQDSTIFSPKAVLEAIEKAGALSAEKAILARHEEALDILVNVIGDLVGAEIYCVTCGQSIGQVPDLEELDIVQPGKMDGKKYKGGKKSKKAQAVKKLQSIKVDEKQRSLLLLMLLRRYMAMSQRTHMISRTRHLLSTYGHYFDVLEVLEIIPQDWSLDIVSSFLITALRQTTRKHREGKILLSLAKAEHLKASIGKRQSTMAISCRH